MAPSHTSGARRHGVATLCGTGHDNRGLTRCGKVGSGDGAAACQGAQQHDVAALSCAAPDMTTEGCRAVAEAAESMAPPCPKEHDDMGSRWWSLSRGSGSSRDCAAARQGARRHGVATLCVGEHDNGGSPNCGRDGSGDCAAARQGARQQRVAALRRRRQQRWRRCTPAEHDDMGSLC